MTSRSSRPASSVSHGSMPTSQSSREGGCLMVTAGEVDAIATGLPRTERYILREYLKFRVGRLVYLSISPDETTIGFGYPKEERAALVAAEPAKFHLPRTSDLRYHWVCARLAAPDEEEVRELVLDAWRMVVPKRVAAAHLGG